MMIFKSALRQLKKNKFMNTLIVIQLAAVMTIMWILVSMIESRMEYYKPFSEEFSSKGYLCNFDLPISESEITSRLNGAKCEFTYSGQFYVNGQSAEGENVPQSAVLTDKWISAYTPEMQSGSWLDNLPNDGYLHIAVTPDNPFKLSTGDTVTVCNIEGNERSAKVIGVTENKQYVVGYSGFSQTDLTNRYNFFDMYYTYNREVESDWGIYFAKSEIDEVEDWQDDIAVYGMGFVLCDNLSDSEISEIHTALATDFSPMYTEPLDEIRTNSFDYIKEQLFVLLPIAVCIFLLTLITTISVISISVSGQLKTYAVFYICGAKWRDCSLISFLYSLIICVFSALLSGVALLFVTQKSLTVIKTGIYEFAAVLAVTAVYLALSAVIPIAVTHGNQPKNILKKE
jgi:hypothetical protein